MSNLRKTAATASALALAAGATLVGAGAASAQSAEMMGSLGQPSPFASTQGVPETVSDLESAAAALNGPVKVAGDGEGGPSVTYTNTSKVAERCVGFAFPYATVDAMDVDPANLDMSDLGAAVALIQGIEGGGDLALLTADVEGAAVSMKDPNPDDDNDVINMVVPLVFGLPGAVAVTVEAGESVTWDAADPEVPAAAATICFPEGGDMAVEFGIDPQVIADQVNDKLGPLGSVDASMISAGSVESAAGSLGSGAAPEPAAPAPEDPPAEDE